MLEYEIYADVLKILVDKEGLWPDSWTKNLVNSIPRETVTARRRSGGTVEEDSATIDGSHKNFF